ncbi:adhesion and hyphal regulator 1 [Podospora aff. communis PSN243]|uniref:Adhesion and hyphal regulator 1 n=1 Tax=Podospora aff. communis PSN243 TaxID=3040156 RepID=A0AAV9GQZ6_9PEZI|nr:adhesion and hyphal regulator 1 [Podospora aff. communis PSN243]
MSDYYHHFLSSMAGVGGQPTANPLESPQPMAQPSSMPPTAQGMPNPYQSLGYFTGFPEPIMFNAPKAQRSRRKSAPGLDHIKHRRTRSGCYTCRSRRVKCDENHPTCERCRKGKRECNYPEPTPTKGSGTTSKDSSGPSQQTSPSSSPGDDDDDGLEHDLKLDPIVDEDEEEPESATTQSSAPIFPLRRSSTASSFSLQRVTSSHRQESETPSFEGNVSSASPSIAAGAGGGLTPTALQLSDSVFVTPGTRPDWSFLPQELQFYLRYYVENITSYHYCIVSNTDDFFRTTLPSLALRNEPLLYAVVGFAAYHHMLKNPSGQISEFLQYYNRSVTLLLAFLKKKERHSVTTLLTILQLATIEEYLGDWVNLMGHQKAAFELLTQLFTPQTIAQTSLGRTIMRWYARFDVFIGIMGSFPTSLSRAWFSTVADFCSGQAAANPSNVTWKIEACDARLRLISMEMALLFGKGASQEVTREEYAVEHDRLTDALNGWKKVWENTLNDPAHLVMDVGTDAMDVDDIVSPGPGLLFRPPLFAATILNCEWHSISLMHASQSASDTSEETRAALVEHANAICRTCATVEGWQQSPPGSLIILHPCLAIAALFVQPDAKHHMWIRKKLALLEGMGYISPITMRRRMAELFRDDSCIRWWLPNDEGFTPTVQNIRAFADERNATAVSAQSENVRQIRNVFSKMHIGPSGGRSETVDASSRGGN